MRKQSSAPVVQSASDFATVVTKLMPSTKVILIEDKNIPRDDNVWSQAKTVPGIKSVLVMRSSPNQELLLYHNALAPMTKPTPADAPVPPDNDRTNAFKEDDWVLVKYDETTYPGTVATVVGSEMRCQ